MPFVRRDRCGALKQSDREFEGRHLELVVFTGHLGIHELGERSTHLTIARPHQRWPRSREAGTHGATTRRGTYISRLALEVNSANLIHTVGEMHVSAKRLIDGASFGPDTLRVIGQAFDAAWEDVAGNFGDIPAQVE